MKKLLFFLFTTATVVLFAQNNIAPIGTYKTGVFDEGAAEIVAYDAQNQQVFFTNAAASNIGVLDVSDPTLPVLTGSLDISAYGSNANSVAVNGSVVAVAVEDPVKQNPGKIVFFDLDGNYLSNVSVGALPDMVTFSASGTIVMTANEGEPSDDYTNDPVGSISIVDLSNGVAGVTQNNVTTLDFSAIQLPNDASIRIFGNDGQASIAQDLEPEYVSIAPNEEKAFVVCQENNAIVVVNLLNRTIENVFGLGFKDHSLAGNGMDASNRSEQINISTWPVFGMPLPDAIKSFENNGILYIATANEGDSRDYDGYSEEERIGDLTLDPTAFPNAVLLQNDTNLGRLNITTTLGDLDNDGDYDALYSYGTRSFSIYDEAGNLVFDSGDAFEQTISSLYPEQFNSNNDDNDSFKARSDDKGPEPEAIEIAMINGVRYAFIGMERMGGIFVYDITDPANATQVGFFLNRNFSVPAEDANAGDLGVEDIKFIPANMSPNQADLLITANEVSGTVSFFSVALTTSIDELAAKQSFTVYPNPASGGKLLFSVSGNYELFNLSGKRILSVENANELNIEGLTSGTYIVKNNKGQVQKVSIQ